MNNADAGQGASLQSLVESGVTARVVAASADLALIIDGDGRILEVSLGDAIAPHPGWSKLIGQLWKDTVLRDSHGKVDQLLAEARDGQKTRAREVNQAVDGLGEVVFRFTGVVLGADKRVVVMGRDQRPLSNMQQQLVTAQQAMDREYGRLRQADVRYRVLFHVCSEGAVIVDGTTRAIVEANPAAASMLGESAQALQGKPLDDLFEARSKAAIDGMLAAIEAGAKPPDLQVTLQGEPERTVTAAASVFRQGGAPVFLIRFWTGGGAASWGARSWRMLAVLDAIPEGFVVTDQNRRILCANAAFCELVQQANENQVLGEPLDRWLGRPGVDLNIMLANLREHGSVRNFATIIRSDFGPTQEGIVTAVSALDGKAPCLGFAIRTVSSKLASAPASAFVPRSVEQLRELVGRVSLKELVRESADLIERLCIEAALDVSGNNRASAAQLLGLSRQGLYSKLRRHGLAEFGPT